MGIYRSEYPRLVRAFVSEKLRVRYWQFLKVVIVDTKNHFVREID